ncbi:hypothetical protein LOTGIDRAFT_161436, partial [Lottia gigantea]
MKSEFVKVEYSRCPPLQEHPVRFIYFYTLLFETSLMSKDHIFLTSGQTPQRKASKSPGRALKSVGRSRSRSKSKSRAKKAVGRPKGSKSPAPASRTPRSRTPRKTVVEDTVDKVEVRARTRSRSRTRTPVDVTPVRQSARISALVEKE